MTRLYIFLAPESLFMGVVYAFFVWSDKMCTSNVFILNTAYLYYLRIVLRHGYAYNDITKDQEAKKRKKRVEVVDDVFCLPVLQFNCISNAQYSMRACAVQSEIWYYIMFICWNLRGGTRNEVPEAQPARHLPSQRPSQHLNGF